MASRIYEMCTEHKTAENHLDQCDYPELQCSKQCLKHSYQKILLFYFYLVPPEVSIEGELTETPEIEAGSTLSLAVNISAFNLDLTNITWSHNGTNLMSVQGQNRISITSSSLSTPAPVSSTLERTSVIPLDAGEYTVSANNPAGSSNFTFQVVVTGKVLIFG